ncbi:MAG TPA: flagellar motor switch protein FliN [Leptospiraceae bacterium]|nr:flagellar motor switch protein FliN [Spirochaetaceae bacterium]HBS05615.1 flagellar motor switch protein FliN [Leptospiraceae bacterium]|tara:strand:- start:1943 stop:2521 length:579 start_codon:yes stop_codon:yes gene_type:complete
MAEESQLSQEEIDQLLGGDSPGGGDQDAAADDLDLDSLLTDDPGGGGGGGDDSGGGDDAGMDLGDMGLDQESLNAIAGAVGGSGPGGGGGSDRSGASAAIPAAPPENRDNAELLLDVNLRFSVELGRTQMYIKDVLMLGEGSIVELDKNVGDEVDILVNDRLFGRGRLVVVDEFFAVQITQILDPIRRYRLS